VEEVLLKTPAPEITSEDFEQVLESIRMPLSRVEPEETGEPRERKPARHPIIITEEDLRRYGLR